MSRRTQHFISLFILALLFACGGCSGSASDPVGGFNGVQTPETTALDTGIAHDNKVNFLYYTSQVSQMGFSETDHSITPGQPWDGVSSQNTEGEFVIDVRCGRKNSKVPDDWFWSYWNQNNPFICAKNSSTIEGQMNFALSGTLTINGYSYNIVLGQSYISTSWPENVWYMIGIDFTVAQSGYMVTPDGRFGFAPGGNDNTFSFVSMNSILH